MPRKPEQLRSARWFAADDLRSFGHRSRMMQMGYAPEDWAGRPVIGILNTWSDLNPCHAHFKSRVDDIKRGVLQAGGLPVEMPAISMSETFMKPTTMLYRNLLAMETEEQIRSHPIDGVGADGRLRQDHAGAHHGRAQRRRADDLLAGRADAAAATMPARSSARARTPGSSGTSAAPATSPTSEWLGHRGRHRALLRPLHDHGHRLDHDGDRRGDGADPARRARRFPPPMPATSGMASASGRRIVEMVWDDLTPDRIVTEAAIDNAAKVAMATGCSTNAVIHLIAMARRAGVELTLDDLDALGRTTPLIANIRPSGQDLSDGGFLLRRRPARADGQHGRNARPRLPDRLRARRSARRCKARSSTMTKSSGRWTIRSITKARWRC